MTSQPDEQLQRPHVVVVSPDGMATSTPTDGDATGPAAQVEEPAKVMRIGSMVRQLLEEVKAAPLDEPSRRRLGKLYAVSVAELKTGLAPELAEELDRLAVPFGEGEAPSDAELRISHAQLVGWLEGLFHGIQTALFAQQMAARAQLEQMRALPPGVGHGGAPSQAPAPGQPPEGGGMYL